MFFGWRGRRDAVRSGALPPGMERRRITWTPVAGARGLRWAEVDGVRYELRFNDARYQSLCTLMESGRVVAEIDELSTHWRFP